MAKFSVGSAVFRALTTGAASLSHFQCIPENLSQSLRCSNAGLEICFCAAGSPYFLRACAGELTAAFAVFITARFGVVGFAVEGPSELLGAIQNRQAPFQARHGRLG